MRTRRFSGFRKKKPAGPKLHRIMRIMLTMVWNPHGFHLVSLLPKGQKWTSQYYIDHILPEICALRDARDRRKLVVHADNARSHVAKRLKQYLEDSNLKSAPHPPYSPDCSKTLMARFHEWLQRLQACVDGDGKHVG
jgi:hypothetical protein